MTDKAILFGIIAVVALFVAGCVSQTATPSGTSAVTDAQVNDAVGEVDKALAEIDSITDELSAINSQDVNSSVVDATG